MSTDISYILKQIEQIAVECEFNNGIGKDALNEMLVAISVTNPEVFEVYSWKNGCIYNSSKENSELCSFGYLLPVEVATQMFNDKEFLGFKEGGYFPFISDFLGEYLLLKADSPQQSVFIYSPGLFIVEPEPIFENLTTFLSSIYECYLSGAYIVRNGKLEVDMDAESGIFRKNSSAYGLWGDNIG